MTGQQLNTGRKGSVERQEIVELFPRLDLTEVFVEYSHLSSEALIELILDKKNQIPIKHDTCTRLMLKACSFAVELAGRWPRWLGGCMLGTVFSAIETKIFSAVDTKQALSFGELTVRERVECSVCWEAATVEQLCFCDPVINNRNAGGKTHAFCRTCLTHHGSAALEEMPLDKRGLGLRCMVADCDNPITLQEISQFSPELALKLDERCAELSVTQAGLSYMERCRKCNCAVELGSSPTVMQVFRCPDCKSSFCRLCDEPWQQEHRGISCDEFAQKQNSNRLLEKRLNEAVVHNCPKCKLAFVKRDGCNKVTCRCGETQCYICRQNGITYDHFCRCLREKNELNGTIRQKCNKCSKVCLLWESSTPIEERDMERIKREVKEELRRKAERAKWCRNKVGASTSKAGTSAGQTGISGQAGTSSDVTVKHMKTTRKEEDQVKPAANKQKSRIPLGPLGRLFN